MNLIDKLLKWNELHIQLKESEKVCFELANDNLNLISENIRLRSENEKLQHEIEELRGIA